MTLKPLWILLAINLLLSPVSLAVTQSAAQAESPGLVDLRRSLQQLRRSEPIALDVQFKLFGRSGEDKDLQEREGLLQQQ